MPDKVKFANIKKLLDQTSGSKKEWVEAYNLEVNALGDTASFDLLKKFMKPHDIEDKIRTQIGSSIPLKIVTPALDVRPENPMTAMKKGFALLIYDTESEALDTSGVLHVLSDLPIKFMIMRIFTVRRYTKKVNLACRHVFEGKNLDVTQTHI